MAPKRRTGSKGATAGADDAALPALIPDPVALFHSFFEVLLDVSRCGWLQSKIR